MAFPTINAKTRVEQSKDERELNFAEENNVSPSRRSARKWQGDDASPRYENDSIEGNSSIHDPDMKWNGFSGRANGVSSHNVPNYGNGALKTNKHDDNPMNLMPGHGGSVELNDRR